MINVVIIDDEYLVRESIKKSLDWSSLGMQIAGEAKDGRQALELILSRNPDIVIVDINIPFINGIELSKKVRESNPAIKIIIVTGYGEFEYAREAIEAGVLKYLLKPIDSKELVQVLVKAQKEIDEEKKTKLYIESLEKKNLTIEREKFLNKLVTGDEAEQTLKEKIGYYSLGIGPEKLSVAVIVIDDIKDKFKEDREAELWKFAVSNISGEVFSEYFKSAVFYGPDQQIVVIFNNLMNGEIEISRQLCEKIRKTAKEYLKFTLTLGIGKVYNGYQNISRSYNEALYALKERFLLGFDRVIVYNSEKNFNKASPGLHYYNRDYVLFELRVGNIENVKREIEKVFSELVMEKSSKEHSVFIAMNLMSLVLEFLNENNIGPDEITSGDILETLTAKETNDSLKNFVLSTYLEAINRVFQKRNMGISRTVEKAKNFIEKSLTDYDLSLEKVAENILINSSYLSSIFKQEMGVSITEYITTCRLNRAKELLDKGKCSSIEQLAYSVGYNDNGYFYKCFKRNFGLTPKKYIENKSVK